MAKWLLRLTRTLLKPFIRDEGGHIALIFALAGPGILVIGVGAIDLNHVHSARTRIQDIADAAALAGANELGLAIDDNSAIERAKAFVQGHMDEWPKAPETQTTVQVVLKDGERIIEVRIDGHSDSFFGSMLPPGGWKYHGAAKAKSVGLTPLCVLVISPSGSKTLNVKDSGRLAAPQCLVHSNNDILVEGGSIAASQVQAVRSATGVISPSPGTGGAAIDDPFVSLNLNEDQPCPEEIKHDVKTGIIRIPAGVHCGGYTAAGDAQIILEPGDHWFIGGHLEVKENARMTGSDVALLFDKDSKFDFKDHALISLDGRKSGTFAGMVMIATRGNTQDFIITSDQVENLLGVIYVPNAQLIVEGKADVARDSAWTVIVARLVQLKGSPSVIINANYNVSDVPVPEGVGPRAGGAQLVE